jgi:hypothetical protein
MLLTYGGGDLAVRTGGDAAGNMFYVGRGEGNLRIGGGLVPSMTQIEPETTGIAYPPMSDSHKVYYGIFLYIIRSNT